MVHARFNNLVSVGSHRCIDSADKTWDLKMCSERKNQTAPVVQVKRAEKGNMIYCYPGEIKTNNFTLKCPNYVFALPLSQTFEVGNYKYNGKPIRIEPTERENNLDFAMRIFLQDGDNPYELTLNSTQFDFGSDFSRHVRLYWIHYAQALGNGLFTLIMMLFV